MKQAVENKWRLDIGFIKIKFILLLSIPVIFSSEKMLATITEVPQLSPTAKISVLTCSPGAELYSLFGHSAIRVQDSLSGEWIDWVYNYGTFVFSDDFYFKFAKGRLDYALSKSLFYEFQYEYIITGRAIIEQVLNLNPEEKQRLLMLLEENNLPENRVYRYDFFYDNCSTRIRDIINKATNGAVYFYNRSTQPVSFRQAIDNYLRYSKWSDLGIDIVLGLPTDRIMQSGDGMFLPDTLMTNLSSASLSGHFLVLDEEEILPQEYFPREEKGWTPFNVFAALFCIQLAIGWIFRRYRFHLVDRILLGVSGVVGWIILFLWFLTDHTATAWNLNLIWANPINILFAFLPLSVLQSGWRLLWMKIYGILLLAMLLGWFFLPQQLNGAIFPISLGLIYIAAKTVFHKSFFFNLSKNE